MKKLLFAIVLLVSVTSFGQETEFKFTKDGLTDYVVGEVPNKTAPEIYKKVIEWVNKTYNTPKEVIKASIDNDYVRIEGVARKALSIKVPLIPAATYDLRYMIEVSVKDNKYKFDITNMEIYTPPSQYVSGGWQNYNNISWIYKDNGEIRKPYSTFPTELETLFNGLNHSLKEYVNSSETIRKSDNW